MKRHGNGPGGLVYSTDGGTMCAGCRQPVARCTCRASAVAGSADGAARVSRERRAGKVVTVVKGLRFEPGALNELGKQLRTSCASGGTVKDGVIEIQGDHRDYVLERLAALGHAAKRAGG